MLLKPSRQVRGRAYDGPLASLSFADQFADHDQAGCYAHASGKRRTSQLRKRCSVSVTRSPARTARSALIFMGARPAEIRQDAIAEELRDVTLEPRNLARHGVLVDLNELTQLLRVSAGRKRGRADQIDNITVSCRRSASEGVAVFARSGDARVSTGPGAVDRASAGIAFSTVYAGQEAGRVPEDRLRLAPAGLRASLRHPRECLRVPLQPETAKPCRDIHA